MTACPDAGGFVPPQRRVLNHEVEPCLHKDPRTTRFTLLIQEHQPRKDTMNEHSKKQVVQKGSVTYFTKNFERTLLFIMTLIMLGWGLWEKVITYLAK
jgi:hypothetical protein